MKVVLEHRSSLYFRRHEKRSCWHLKVEGAPAGFSFPPWVEIKGLWRQVAPKAGELMCRHEYKGHLVFSVPAKTMTHEVKKLFVAGIIELVAKMEEVHAS